MFNVLIRIGYDGAAYSGFQIQENVPTVQGEIEKALAVIYKEPLRLIGAGRTDAGVHAREMIANYHAPFNIDLDKIPHALNCLLPDSIVVHGASAAKPEFHARFDAKGKIYSYTIDQSEYPQIQKRLYSWHLPGPLELKAMDRAAILFKGSHDFAFFQASGSTITDTVRTIYRVELQWLPAEKILIITFEGNGFLYRMVRLITGSLVRIGKGELTEKQVKAALDLKDRSAVGPTAPAHGLCLEKVLY
jgi:tRNA pseudouridine38-40 synthase